MAHNLKVSGFAIATEFMLKVHTDDGEGNTGLVHLFAKVEQKDDGKYSLSVSEGYHDGWGEMSVDEIGVVRQQVVDAILDGTILFPKMFDVKSFVNEDVDEEVYETLQQR